MSDMDDKEIMDLMERVEALGNDQDLDQIDLVMHWCMEKFQSMGWKEEHMLHFFAMGFSSVAGDTVGGMRVDYDDGSFVIAGTGQMDILDLLGSESHVQVIDLGGEENIDDAVANIAKHIQESVEQIADGDLTPEEMFAKMKKPKGTVH